MTRIIIAFCLLTTIAYAQHEYKLEHKQSADKIDEVLVDCPAGHIYFEPSDNKEITVQARKIVYLKDENEADQLAEACKIDFRENNRILEVMVDLPGKIRSGEGLVKKFLDYKTSKDIEVMIRVLLPINTPIEIKTASADVSISDLKGNDLRMNGSSADLTAEDAAGNYAIDLSSGDVEVSGLKGNIEFYGSSSDFDLRAVQGNIDITTSSGDGLVEKATGDMHIRTNSGDLRVYSLGGNMDIKSSSGDIIAEDVSGSVTAETSSGTVRMRHLTDKRGRFQISTVSGDVIMDIPPGFEGQLELETSSGRIESELEQLETSIKSYARDYIAAVVGQGDGEIDVRTNSGDITLEIGQ